MARKTPLVSCDCILAAQLFGSYQGLIPGYTLFGGSAVVDIPALEVEGLEAMRGADWGD